MIYVTEGDPLRYQDPKGIQITGYGYGEFVPIYPLDFCQ
jgi:hypothetical protein